MDGNQRDLTVKLRLMADEANKSTAKAMASEMKSVSSEIVSAHDHAIESGKELRKASRETAKSVVDELGRQSAAHKASTEISKRYAAEYASIGQQIRSEAANFTIGNIEDTKTLDEIKLRHRELTQEAKEGTETVRAAMLELADAYGEVERHVTGGIASAKALAAADQALAEAQLKVSIASDDAANIEKELTAIRKEETKATKELAAAEANTAKAVANAAKVGANIHKERAKIQKQHDNSLKESAKHQAAAIRNAKALAGGLTQLARSYALATAASDEDAQAALKTIATMESIVQGIQGTIETGQAAVEMWQNLKAAKEAYNNLKNLRSGGSLLSGAASAASSLGGVGTFGGAAATGGGAAAAGGGGAASAAAVGLAAPVAAFAAAVGGFAFAANAIKETATGEASGGKTWYSRNFVQNRVDGTFSGKAQEVAGSVLTLGLKDVLQNANGTTAAVENARKSKKKTERLLDVKEKIKKQQAVDNKFFFEDRDKLESERSEKFARGSFRAGSGLQGTARDKAINEFATREALQRSATARAGAKDGASKTAKIQAAHLQDAKDAQQDLIRLRQDEFKIAKRQIEEETGLAKKAASEAIRAKQKELSLSSKQLAIAERKRQQAQSAAVSLAERLVFSTKGERKKLAKAVESAKDGTLEKGEIKTLDGIGKFDKVRQDNLLRIGQQVDTTGLLQELLDNVKAAKTAEVKAKANNEQKKIEIGEIKTALTLKIEESKEGIEKARQEANDAVNKLFDQRLDELAGAINAQQNAEG